MASPQKFSGFNVPQKWDRGANYQGGQGGQLVTHALVTWRAIKPKNGVPPGTITGQWEQVPATITSPTQAATPAPVPKPAPPAPKVVVTGTAPVRAVNNNVAVDIFQPSGDGAFQGLVPAPPDIAGTALFLREDATWAAAGGGGGTVTSVALALPTEFNITGSPVTTTGTLTGAWIAQSANTGFMGPASGVAATPGFRALVPLDIGTGTPAAGKYVDGGTGAWTTLPAPGTGTVTSVGVSSNASYLTVGSTPVTTSGVITVNKTTGLTANQVVATPNGAPGAADLRSLVNADFPTSGVSAGSYTYSAITVNAQGIITSASSGAAPTGTVTSVALSMPSFLTVSGSPVTTSGTLTAVLATQSANLVFAGPSSGAAADPTFRAIVPLDLASGGTATKFYRGDGVFATVPGASLPPAVAAGGYLTAYNSFF